MSKKFQGPNLLDPKKAQKTPLLRTLLYCLLLVLKRSGKNCSFFEWRVKTKPFLINNGHLLKVRLEKKKYFRSSSFYALCIDYFFSWEASRLALSLILKGGLNSCTLFILFFQMNIWIICTIMIHNNIVLWCWTFRQIIFRYSHQNSKQT